MSENAADQLFLGRQPILDRNQQLFAYELLFRSGSHNFADITDQFGTIQRITLNNTNLFLGASILR